MAYKKRDRYPNFGHGMHYKIYVKSLFDANKER